MRKSLRMKEIIKTIQQPPDTELECGWLQARFSKSIFSDLEVKEWFTYNLSELKSLCYVPDLILCRYYRGTSCFLRIFLDGHNMVGQYII